MNKLILLGTRNLEDFGTDSPGDYCYDYDGDHAEEEDEEEEVKIPPAPPRVMYNDEEFIWTDCPMWDCFSCLTYSHDKKFKKLMANDDQNKPVDVLIQEFLITRAKEIKDQAREEREAQDEECAAQDMAAHDQEDRAARAEERAI